MPESAVKRLVLWGSAGQAKVLHELMSQQGYEIVALFDNDPEANSSIEGVPLYIGREGFESWLKETRPQPQTIGCLVAIGGLRGRDRHEIQQIMEKSGLRPEVAIHPTATVSASAWIGRGSQVLAGAIVGVDVWLGEACIVNTGAIVDHDNVIGDGVHIAPGCRLAGEIEIGPYSTVGVGSVILPKIKIGREVVIGAGSVVTRNIDDFEVVAGSPAKPIGGHGEEKART